MDPAAGAGAPGRVGLTEWERLAREDPAEFERRRQAAIEGAIARAPVTLQPRLRGLQFRIELERERARTPLGAAVRLNAMMWDEFQRLREALNRLTELDPRRSAQAPVTPAQVIPFRPRG
jgi:hypothetical protein